MNHLLLTPNETVVEYFWFTFLGGALGSAFGAAVMVILLIRYRGQQ